MPDSLFKKWGDNYKIITGDEKVNRPDLLPFKNTDKALKMLHKHINNNSKIAIHCDVDMDGIGTGYILKRFMQSLKSTNHLFIINKEKIHGIQKKHVEYFNNTNVMDLIIILDSSCNEIDYVKKLNCDVLVVDHHEILHNDSYGVRENGTEYVIVTNMLYNSEIDEINEYITNINPNAIEFNEEYSVENRMSCGLVLYELLRIYQTTFNTGDILGNLMLYQWVGLTLFTDAVILNTKRNQWYIENTVHSMELESTLGIITNAMNSYKLKLDKSFISYSLAPAFNRAIRAGASGEALDIVLNKPNKILELNKYREAQDKAVSLGTSKIDLTKDYIIKDTSNLEIHENYNGVIAGRLCGEHDKNTVVFKVINGIAMGSFRGRHSTVDYRAKFHSMYDNVYAEGHGPAFGFKVDINLLENIMDSLKEIEPLNETREYLTVGNVSEDKKGIHHIDNIDDFKRAGNVWRMAIGNSKVASNEEITLVTPLNQAVLDSTIGKMFKYNVLGMECKAFEPLSTDMVRIYAEYSKEIDFYVRNI